MTVAEHGIRIWPAVSLNKTVLHPKFMAYPGMIGQIYHEFDFVDETSLTAYTLASNAVNGDVMNTLLPHEVILMGCIEYGHNEKSRVQYGWVVYSTFSHVRNNLFRVFMPQQFIRRPFKYFSSTICFSMVKLLCCVRMKKDWQHCECGGL